MSKIWDDLGVSAGGGHGEECRKECLEYEDVILVTTLAEVEDTAILEETLKTREGHEEVIRSLRKDLKEAGWQVLALCYRVL